MKIALLGYGKMGKIIEKIATSRKHEIVLTIDHDNLSDLTTANLQKADVAIEFSTPATVKANIQLCFDATVPVVVGTTGWHANLAEIQQRCEERSGSMIYATNFSVGVNLFFHINKVLAKLMNNYPYYDVQVEEIHHTQKLDSPSGTAITIAQGIIDNLDRKKDWVNVLTAGDDETADDNVKIDELLIESFRINNVPGTHTVLYDSEVDTVELKHTAHNRNGFALGAVLAAEWIVNNPGFHPVQDMFDFSTK